MNEYLPDSSPRAVRGFTLIELMIVLAVIGILAAIAYPQYQQFVMKSRRSDAKTALLDLASREERYFSINNTYTNSPVALGYGTGTTFPINVNSSGQTFYQINVASVTAGSSTALPGFIAQAAPTGTQVNDTTCGTYLVNQAGTQSNSTGVTTGCW